MVKSRTSNLQFRNRSSIEGDEDQECSSFHTKRMTQPQIELPTHCYCGIYNVIRTSAIEKNLGRRFMSCKAKKGNYILHKKIKKLEMEKTSYQMKMKAWLVAAVVSWLEVNGPATEPDATAYGPSFEPDT
ncbi:hypothetical protein M9H77_14073 [Catharanthus roseus]|uniref:Uncharacterized protein n=1 Tax=Catharanthus roseus TaxID=4058 RepID=A0ACC0BM69_CATRO|nr:hypothetical protein M9H77_14073 [Catharanthus roseus]